MKTRASKKATGLLFATALLGMTFAGSKNAWADTEVHIIRTSDVHTRYGMFFTVATAAQRIKQDTPEAHVALVDCGDLLTLQNYHCMGSRYDVTYHVMDNGYEREFAALNFAGQFCDKVAYTLGDHDEPVVLSPQVLGDFVITNSVDTSWLPNHQDEIYKSAVPYTVWQFGDVKIGVLAYADGVGGDGDSEDNTAIKDSLVNTLKTTEGVNAIACAFGTTPAGKLDNFDGIDLILDGNVGSGDEVLDNTLQFDATGALVSVTTTKLNDDQHTGGEPAITAFENSQVAGGYTELFGERQGKSFPYGEVIHAFSQAELTIFDKFTYRNFRLETGNRSNEQVIMTDLYQYGRALQEQLVILSMTGTEINQLFTDYPDGLSNWGFVTFGDTPPNGSTVHQVAMGGWLAELADLNDKIAQQTGHVMMDIVVEYLRADGADDGIIQKDVDAGIVTQLRNSFPDEVLGTAGEDIDAIPFSLEVIRQFAKADVAVFNSAKLVTTTFESASTITPADINALGPGLRSLLGSETISGSELEALLNNTDLVYAGAEKVSSQWTVDGLPLDDTKQYRVCGAEDWSRVRNLTDDRTRGEREIGLRLEEERMALRDIVIAYVKLASTIQQQVDPDAIACITRTFGPGSCGPAGTGGAGGTQNSGGDGGTPGAGGKGGSAAVGTGTKDNATTSDDGCACGLISGNNGAESSLGRSLIGAFLLWWARRRSTKLKAART